MQDSLLCAFNSPLLAAKCNIIWPRHGDVVPEKWYRNQRRNKQEIAPSATCTTSIDQNKKKATVT